MVASNGFEIAVLSQTAFEAFKNAAGLESDWTTMPLYEREAWEHVAGQALLQLDNDRDDYVKAAVLASDLFEAFNRAHSHPGVFTDLSLEERLCWEAVGRHLFNLIDSDGSVSPSEHESRWRDWVRAQVQKRSAA